ncbi:hypothetical protein ACUH93_08715 [Dermabacteraceae bacterium P7006]
MSLKVSPPKFFRWFFMAVFATLVVAGCGGKIDTQVSINDDGSGSRAMSVTVSAEDMKKVEGGQGSIEKLIADLKPAGLEYGGAKKNGDSTVFSFSVPFKDTQDYAAKVNTILDASNPERPDKNSAEVSLVKGVPPFSVGAEYRENFTSEQLLSWLPEGLKKQGKLNENNVLETGSTKLVISGKESEAKSQPISSGEVQRFGFDEVYFVTDGVGTGSYQRTGHFKMDKAVYLRDSAGYDKFFADNAPAGSDLSKTDGAQISWTLKFPAGDAAQVNEYTNKILLTNDSLLAVNGPVASEEPLTFVTTVEDKVTCEVVCADRVEPKLFFVIPQGWESNASGDEIDGVQVATAWSNSPVSFTQKVAFSKQSLAIEINPEGGGKATHTVTFPLQNDKLVSELVPDWLKGVSNAEVKRSESKDEAVYTAVVSGKDAKAFNAALSDYDFGQDPVALIKTDGGLASDTYMLSANLSVPGRVSRVSPDVAFPVSLQGTDGLTIDKPEKAVMSEKMTFKDGVVSSPDAFNFIFNGSASVSRMWLVWTILGVTLAALAAIVFGALTFLKKRAQRDSSDDADESEDTNSSGMGEQPLAAYPVEGEQGGYAPADAQPGYVPTDYPTERLDLAPPVNDNLTQPLPSYADGWQVPAEGEAPAPVENGEWQSPVTEDAGKAARNEIDPESDATKG